MNQDVLYLVPRSYLERLEASQAKILSLLESGQTTSNTSIGDYISEQEAKKLIGRKSTWFWQMRTKGLLAYTTVGNKVYYARQDILALLDKNRKEAFAMKLR